MQKVEGSSPFSRLQKPRKSGVSLCATADDQANVCGSERTRLWPTRTDGRRQAADPRGDEAIERANADLDDTIRQLGELGLLGRPASQQTLEKLTAALDDA